MFEFFEIKNVFFWFFFPLSSRWNAPAGSALIDGGVDSGEESGGRAAYAALWWNEKGEAERAIKLWFQFVFIRLILISISFFWVFANASIMHCKFRAVSCFIKINKKPFMKKKLKKIHRIHSFNFFFFYWFFFLHVCDIFSFFFKSFSNLFEYFSWNSRIKSKTFFISMTDNHESSENEYFNHRTKYWN